MTRQSWDSQMIDGVFPSSFKNALLGHFAKQEIDLRPGAVNYLANFNLQEFMTNFTPSNARIALINSKIMNRVLPAEPPRPGLFGPCLIWQGPLSGAKTASRASRGHSYPRMTLDGQTVAVHRVLWVNTYGYLPGKKQLDHLCKVRMCVSPFHCEKVTHKENQKRRDRSNG